MINTLIITQIILVILITAVVLMQKSSSIGLGAYSGSNEGMFGAKGPASFLTKATFLLALLFIINTLSLVYLYNSKKDETVFNKVKVEKKSTIPQAPIK